MVLLLGAPLKCAAGRELTLLHAPYAYFGILSNRLGSCPRLLALLEA